MSLAESISCVLTTHKCISGSHIKGHERGLQCDEFFYVYSSQFYVTNMNNITRCNMMGTQKFDIYELEISNY